uniref:Uncharacterized protein n=1 Tax=Anguilla anguilla TaxID=7936 RepID=A0A0E9PM92_ANGAN
MIQPKAKMGLFQENGHFVASSIFTVNFSFSSKSFRLTDKYI